MPNWCANKLTIRGDPNRLDAFMKANHGPAGEDLLFSALVPMPAKFEAMDPGLAANMAVPMAHLVALMVTGEREPENWYEWRLANWGTKWEPEVGSVFFSPEAKVLVYKFYTAWSEPTMWLGKVGAMFQDLSFRLEFYEPGNNFAGFIVIELGQAVAHHRGDYEGCFDCHSKQCCGDCDGKEECHFDCSPPEEPTFP